jgi:hypothetical protein
VILFSVDGLALPDGGKETECIISVGYACEVQDTISSCDDLDGVLDEAERDFFVDFDDIFDCDDFLEVSMMRGVTFFSMPTMDP